MPAYITCACSCFWSQPFDLLYNRNFNVNLSCWFWIVHAHCALCSVSRHHYSLYHMKLVRTIICIWNAHTVMSSPSPELTGKVDIVTCFLVTTWAGRPVVLVTGAFYCPDNLFPKWLRVTTVTHAQKSCTWNLNYKLMLVSRACSDSFLCSKKLA